MKTSIIPEKPVFVKIPAEPHSVNQKAVVIFAALGFYLDGDTFWRDEKAILGGKKFEVDAENRLVSESDDFQWHYQPTEISFDDCLEKFRQIFESSIRNYCNGKLIVPISGGLDSRTIAASLTGHRDINAYSYRFSGGVNELQYGRKVADVAGFNFHEYTIPPGYLWNQIERLAQINGCNSEFTHPRQMYIIDELPKLGELIILGHGGDLFFDSMHVSDLLPFEGQVDYLMKNLVKKGGMDLATDLWRTWELDGAFVDFLRSRIEQLLSSIHIDNANARLRAFKTKYYVSRWSVTNMQIFARQVKLFAPYFTDEMCKFICTVPEQYLKGRKIQIEYLKKFAPALAKIRWQAKEPYNLFNHGKHRTPAHYPWRLKNKVTNEFRKSFLKKPLIQRNWEIQFVGEENDRNLRLWLFGNSSLDTLVPKEITKRYYDRFSNEDHVSWSHPVSMLLTLSVMAKNQYSN